MCHHLDGAVFLQTAVFFVPSLLSFLPNIAEPGRGSEMEEIAEMHTTMDANDMESKGDNGKVESYVASTSVMNHKYLSTRFRSRKVFVYSRNNVGVFL